MLTVFLSLEVPLDRGTGCRSGPDDGVGLGPYVIEHDVIAAGQAASRGEALPHVDHPEGHGLARYYATALLETPVESEMCYRHPKQLPPAH